ncbi:MAG: hypothetical protein UX77_C0003G0070 [Parcubacteria group bacterium GW2011_GWA1_47_11]|uniref:Aminoglycoside phosphotransferase domain-containing protein n=1 Tax=Candidatus Colwellbacteria bacterium GWA2_46_10 TaxID=1797684 RepID=A0A1G1YW27_9BACT|nr:MAG: hypothetical protein UX29_C0001G0056 [Parcubacteria group bacterium GW2011_GWA2_46_10]KKU56192.1 MAG: hypothetical protein UX77_C0003G0070 [Parcubacteria group bacterium GW2011_GWA1_47_11]OGY56572.1 MAG: hypothetical protein A2119_01570 [Candidatus Colwellbacteria bacterium GWA2_46_10]
MIPLVDHTLSSISQKVSISNEQIVKLLENVFPGNEVQKIVTMPHAYTNKTIKVLLRDDPQICIVKISLVEKRYAGLKLEIELLEKLKKIDIPVPKVFYSDLSLKAFSYPFAVYSFLSGDNLADVIDKIKDQDLLGRELADQAWKIHQLTFKKPYFSLAKPPADSWKQIWEEKMSMALPYFKQAEYSKYDLLSKAVEGGLLKLTEPEKYVLVHRDLQPQNINWDLSSSKIVGIFDFESAMSGDFMFDFALLERGLFKKYPLVKKGFYDEYALKYKLPAGFESSVKFYALMHLVYFYMRSVQEGWPERVKINMQRVTDMLMG